MASYHCSVKVGGKGKASGHAAYIAREGHYAERAGYEDLEATGYGNMPPWAEHHPSYFWNAADHHERANGTTYREAARQGKRVRHLHLLPPETQGVAGALRSHADA